MVTRTSVLVLVVLCLLSGIARAADPTDIFGTILGEIGRQIDRKQQRKQQRRLQPLWQACANGDAVACDKAAEFPLTPQSRQDLARMRTIAVTRPQFERDWAACQQLDVAACDAALEFPGLVAADRTKLLIWRRNARSQAEQVRRSKLEQVAAKNQYRTILYGCLIHERLQACDAALKHPLVTARDRQRLKRKQRFVIPKIEFQRLRAACFRGTLSACRRAERHRQASPKDRIAVAAEAQKLLAAQQLRQRRERERREFATLRHRCLEKTELAACETAAGHALASTVQRDVFRQKALELSSFSHQALSVLSSTAARWNDTSFASTGLVIGALLLPLLAFGIFQLVRAVLPRLAELRRNEDQQEETRNPTPGRPGESLFTQMPLTGHMPTDVRRVLQGYQGV